MDRNVGLSRKEHLLDAAYEEPVAADRPERGLPVRVTFGGHLDDLCLHALLREQILDVICLDQGQFAGACCQFQCLHSSASVS